MEFDATWSVRTSSISVGVCTMYMVQIEALSTPEFQEGFPSQGGQGREEHKVVHHDQVEHYQRQF